MLRVGALNVACREQSLAVPPLRFAHVHLHQVAQGTFTPGRRTYPAHRGEARLKAARDTRALDPLGCGSSVSQKKKKPPPPPPPVVRRVKGRRGGAGAGPDAAAPRGVTAAELLSSQR